MEQLARAFGEEPLPTPAHAAKRALSGRQALLIFDGAEEADHLERVLEVCVDCGVLSTPASKAVRVAGPLALHCGDREPCLAAIPRA